MAASNKNEMGKHPIYLQMPHDLYVALNAYQAKIGVARSKIIFSILRGFLGPLSETPLDKDE